LGFGVWGLKFGVRGLEYDMIDGLLMKIGLPSLRVWGKVVWSLVFWVQGLGFRVQGLGYKVQGLGFRIHRQEYIYEVCGSKRRDRIKGTDDKKYHFIFSY
jgi:hypothetical protein